jgi:hypothetical protein
MFTQETTQNFSDYEVALGDLEKRLPAEVEGTNITDNGIQEINDSLNDIDGVNATSMGMTIDLKNLIKEELSKN